MQESPPDALKGKKVLVVDDESGIRDSLRLLLKNSFEVETAVDGNDALQKVSAFHPDLILMDVMMPSLDGLGALHALRSSSVITPVVMLTAAHEIKTAVAAMKSGAADYLSKPFDIEELTSVILAQLEKSAAQEVIKKVTQEIRRELPPADFGPLVGQSKQMAELFSKLKQVAPRDTTILVTGESGTGKELVARQLHDLSDRKDGPFVAINCAAIPETLIESELFGHEKGAFTNAVEKRIGHFELADGGTLFLDEIGELSLSVQVKLLRFLQEQEFYRVGRSKATKVNVRIVAATNKNLETLVEEKKFRQDLYYRINVIHLEIPPLRDRYDDIERLVAHFNVKFSPRFGGKKLSFTKEAMEVLNQYEWPGNVRELENVIEGLFALSATDTIAEGDLPKKLKSRSGLGDLKTAIFESDIKFDDAEKMFESEMIIKALKKAGYVQTKAAELLGISRRILKYKMDKLGIPDSPESAAQ